MPSKPLISFGSFEESRAYVPHNFLKDGMEQNYVVGHGRNMASRSVSDLYH